MTARKFLLPGAGGSATFWHPVMAQLPADWDMHSLAWPGLGDEPHDPEVDGLGDLVSMVADRMEGATDLIAQSIGCLVALKVALQWPDKVRRMVLAGTSGGLPDALLKGANDWRTGYRQEFPGAQSWITEVREDLSTLLPTIVAPTLLLWGSEDSISPVNVGKNLRAMLPNASLVVIEGGDHDFPQTHPAQSAAFIERHLS